MFAYDMFLMRCTDLNWEKILQKLPLDRPDVREKVEKIQAQLKWPSFPGVHSLLLKGCTHPGTYEATIQALSRFTTILGKTILVCTLTRLETLQSIPS